MQPSANSKPAGQQLAVLAESLYVANLLILPGVAFIALAVLFFNKHNSSPPVAECHLEQSMSASIWAGILFIVCAISIMMLTFTGLQEVTLWMIGITLFTLLHASLVLLGVLGLAKALAGKCWRFPLLGKPLRTDCPQ
jgi:uncharacterized Tic20 family protein